MAMGMQITKSNIPKRLKYLNASDLKALNL